MDVLMEEFYLLMEEFYLIYFDPVMVSRAKQRTMNLDTALIARKKSA